MEDILSPTLTQCANAIKTSRARLAALAEQADALDGAEGFAMGIRAITRQSGEDKSEQRWTEILYFFTQAKKEGVGLPMIAEGLAWGFLDLLWNQASQVETAKKGAGSEKRLAIAMNGDPKGWLRAREQYFDWADALSLPHGELEGQIAQHSQALGMPALRLLAQLLGEGHFDAKEWPAAIESLRRLGSVRQAFDDAPKAQEMSLLAQRFTQAGAVWSWAAGEEAKDAFLRLAKTWPAEAWLRPADPHELFGIPLAMAFMVAPEDPSAQAFYREWADWMASLPGMANPQAPFGAADIASGPYVFHPRRCVQAARIARSAGVDLDARDERGWSLLGWANLWAKTNEGAMVGRLPRETAKPMDWRAVAIELLQMGADPWGLRQARQPVDECEDPELRTIALAATERWAIKGAVEQSERGRATSELPQEAHPHSQETSPVAAKRL